MDDMQINQNNEIMDSLPGMVFEFDTSGRLTYANRQALQILGYSYDEILTMNALQFISTEERERAVRGISRLSKGTEYRSVAYNFVKKDGTTFPVHVYINNIYKDEHIIGARGLAVDITAVTMAESLLNQAKNQNDALVRQTVYTTLYDPLTGLLNRETFMARSQIAIMRYAHRRQPDSFLAVLCLSLDRLKSINDMYGQETGNSAITTTASILGEVLRQDDVLCRYGGNKFLALLMDIDRRESLPVIINKVLDTFRSPVMVNGRSIMLRVSIGLSLYPDDSDNEESLVHHAESAMYSARKKKRDAYQLYDSAMQRQLMERFSMEEELRLGINNDEFIDYYQGKFDRSGCLIGMETLIRWNSPLRGFVPPDSFIKLAESSGLIVEIGNLILHKACMRNREWSDAGFQKAPFSVNLSPFQFQHPDLIKDIVRIVRDTGADPDLIELEITESGIMMNEEEALEKLQELHALGFTLSIDDFGTGYSSLSKLQTYPVDILKIDRSFISPIPGNERSNTITRTIIELGHNLGFSIIAEGVERPDQFQFLSGRDCDYFQGYYFCRPLPPAEFELMLRS